MFAGTDAAAAAGTPKSGSGICTDLAKIVTEQQKLLAQHDAIALAEDIDRVKVRYTALIGSGEWPDEALGEEL